MLLITVSIGTSKHKETKPQSFGKGTNQMKTKRLPITNCIKKSANYHIVGTNESQWGALFAELGTNTADAPPLRPKPLDQDGLLNLFSASETGADFVLQPATDADMRGKFAKPKESLEVVYDEV